MATSDLWQTLSSSVSASPEWSGGPDAVTANNLQNSSKLWMGLDWITIFISALGATLYEQHASPVAGTKGFMQGTVVSGRMAGELVGLLCGYAFALVMTSRRLHLYTPIRITSILHEQKLSAQACFTSGLLLTGTLYLLYAEAVPRRIVLITVGMVTILLGMRRLACRMIIYGRFARGIGTRNVLIVGTGPEAHALRRHLESIKTLGFRFKGFVDFPGSGSRSMTAPGDLVGTMDTLFQNARKQFVDEIFFTAHCERGIVQNVLEQARTHGVDLRVVPHLYDGLAWNNPIEYIGQFPTIALHRGTVPEIRLLVKRILDVVLASLILVSILPVLLTIALAIKLDSRGPVIYYSERIGKKGRVFRCLKFRTMVRDADKRRAEILHMNERDGVLFKISNDPRITRVGRWLRRHSLDELPQFLNVLSGEMSIVGPRPPIATEVLQYNVSHLRRLDVTPGITGLWQIQARKDPSFDSYISLDVTYIENWCIWMDLKIIARTIAVVFDGTGS